MTYSEDMRARLAVSVLCIGVACSGGDVPGDAATTDGSWDAPSEDAAAPESDVPQDTSPDAPLGPDDPGWTRLPGFSDACFVEHARQPEAVLAFHWEPCRDALPHCDMALLDRTVGELHGVAPFQVGVGARTLIWILWDTPARQEIDVLASVDRVLGAWRATLSQSTYCGAALAGGSDGLALDAWQAGDLAMAPDHVGVAPWNDLDALYDATWISGPDVVNPHDFLEAPAGSSLAFAAMTTTGHIVAAEPPEGAVIGDGAEPVVVGRTVLWNWSDATGASAIHVGGVHVPERELYAAPAGTHVYAVRADGQWITWRAGIEDATGQTYRLNELWAAPYRETPPLDAHLYASDLVAGGFSEPKGTLGDGMFAYQGPDETGTHQAIYVIDLAARTRRVYVLPTVIPGGFGWGFQSDPAWVTRDEVVVPAVWSDGVHADTYLRTAVRIDLTALPTEPLP